MPTLLASRDRDLPATLVTLLGLVAAWLVCGATSASARDEPPLTEAEAQQLEALGYLDYAPEKDAESRSGVVVRTDDCECSGYYLLTYPALGRAELIDAAGEVAHSWSATDEVWERTTLAGDGTLLVLARETYETEDDRQKRRRVLHRLDAAGEKLWTRILPVHHHVEVRPGGRLATLTSRWRRVPERFGDQTVLDNGIALLEPDASDILEERSLHDMLAARPDLFRFQVPVAAEATESARGTESAEDTEPAKGSQRRRLDLLHANHFQWLDENVTSRRHPIYADGHVLVTLRKQDSLAIVDFEGGEVVWAWGQGEVIGPHDARVLADGNILLFDNRCRGSEPEEGDGWSRVVELDPLRREIVWEYRADPPEDFYSHSRGTVERLPGGHTLVGSSNQGRVFEVTPAGEIAWEYRTPHRDEEGRRAVLRATHYPEAFVGRHVGQRSTEAASE